MDDNEAGGLGGLYFAVKHDGGNEATCLSQTKLYLCYSYSGQSQPRTRPPLASLLLRGLPGHFHKHSAPLLAIKSARQRLQRRDALEISQ